jgi:UDP-N-acetylmuramoyl-tripeptide--D-alanyl-D-alanine ligase
MDGYMEGLDISKILEVTGGSLIQGDLHRRTPGISIDSRTLLSGELFIALRGSRFDGHDFIEEAVAKGASGAIVSRLSITSYQLPVLIKVKDTLKALGQIAKAYRERFDIPFIGVTGSIGKTTTKEMIASMLARRFETLKSEASFNNDIGVPLTLFRLTPNHRAAVLELGMSAPGQIARLAGLVRPSVGVITNVSPVHIGYLDTLEGIAQAKEELLGSLQDKGKAVLNLDDPYVSQMAARFKGKVITYGVESEAARPRGRSSPKAAIRASNIRDKNEDGSSFRLEVFQESIQIDLPLLGFHNIYNALAAAGAAYSLGLNLRYIKAGLARMEAISHRLELVKIGQVRVLNDAYNASPESMAAAIRILRNLGGEGRRIAVLGDMLELGRHGPSAHQELGRFLASATIDRLLTVGELARIIAQGALKAGMDKGHIIVCGDNKHAYERLTQIIKPGDRVLVKGSRAMAMEEIVERLKAQGWAGDRRN